MRKRKTLILLVGMCLFMLNLSAGELNKRFQLIPLPREIKVVHEKGFFCHELSYIIVEGTDGMPVVSDILDRLPRYKKKGKGVVLKLTDASVPDSQEGYVLETSKEGVVIQARTETGLFYGCQTLAQLMEDSRDFGQMIPLLQITDYPALTYRAVHFDLKHHLDRIDYYYACIDKLARYKVNAVIWELEDKLGYVRRPEVGGPDAISKQEMQAISRYAKERHIEISPLVQGLGHASFILKHHWELREDPQSDWGFCPSEPRTYELQFDLYKDAMEALPDGKYLHIGGDEVPAIGIDDRCLATGKTPFELRMLWLQKVCRFAVENGRTPIFWDDMPLKHAGVWGLFWNNLSEAELDKVWDTQKLDEAISLFPKECIYMRWNYFDIAECINRRVLDWYRRKGLKVMGSTAAAAGDSPIMPRNESRMKEIQGFNELASDCHLMGVLTTAWDDGSPHWETVMRGFIAQGEYGWNPKGRTLEAFKLAHGQREFGFAPEENRMAFLDDLEKSLFFYDTALVASGNRNPAYQCGEFTLIDLPQKNVPGQWSLKYAGIIEGARQEAVRYMRITEGIRMAKEQALRNRYTLDIYEQINQLQNFPTRLILALHAFDTAANQQTKEQAEKELDAICLYFQTMCIHLEQVYSRTRFMVKPEGYLPDSNHPNNLAARSLNSDWMFLYEKPMVQKVKEWLRVK